MSLCFNNVNMVVKDFVDVELGDDLNSRKSTSNYVFTLNVLCLVKNLMIYLTTKHIRLKYQIIHELINDGILSLNKITSEMNTANMFTKMKWERDTNDNVKKLKASLVMLANLVKMHLGLFMNEVVNHYSAHMGKYSSTKRTS
ncbi:hypothetical protein MPTK2_1g21430 [Marchantia polymorpha subsp. ruderalis]